MRGLLCLYLKVESGKKPRVLKSEVAKQAGYGIRTRGLNFGKVACYHYTKPARYLFTKRIIADQAPKVKHFFATFEA